MPQPSLHGLTSQEAARRLAEYGPNAPPESRPPGVAANRAAHAQGADVFSAGGGGDALPVRRRSRRGPVHGGGRGRLHFPRRLSGTAQRAGLAGACKGLPSPRRMCARDGEERRIPARDLVPGDIILVGEGQRVAADALLLAGDALVIDEFDPDRRVGARHQDARGRRRRISPSRTPAATTRPSSMPAR